MTQGCSHGCIPVRLCVGYYENVHQLLRVRNAGMMEQRNVSVKLLGQLL